MQFRNECKLNESTCWTCYGDEPVDVVEYYSTIRWKWGRMQFLINLFKYIPSLCDHEASVLYCYSRILEFALDRRYKSVCWFFIFCITFEIFCSPQGDCGLDVLGGRRHRVRRQLRLNLHSLASICWKVVPVVIYYLTYSVARVQRQQYQKLKLQISGFFSIF